MKIGTHGGKFHGDDVFAVAILLRLFPDAEVIRSRNMDILSKCDILVDVGLEYDAKRGRFDHHQVSSETELVKPDESIRKYSACGLIWKHFGHQYLERIGIASGRDCEYVWNKLDINLIELIDQMDNWMIEIPGYVSVYHLIDSFNHSDTSGPEQIGRFMDAVAFADGIMSREVDRVEEKITALKMIKDNYVEGDAIQHFPKFPIGINEFLDTQEGDETRFITYPSEGLFYVKSARREFFLPERWLTEKPKGCVFFHKGLFIAGFPKREDLLEAVSGL